MKHSYFVIRNFKGITEIRLDFNSQPRSNIYTLVGLNESGKTTILEALNFVAYKTETLDPLNLPGYSVKNVHELIPINKRSNFNDSIQIEAGYELDEDDNRKIVEFFRKEANFELTRQVTECHITHSYKFNDSQLASSQPQILWSIEFYGHHIIKGRRKKVEKELSHIGVTREQWIKSVNFVKTLLPSVLYFPNFLFEFPDKIYLEDAPSAV